MDIFIFLMIVILFFMGFMWLIMWSVEYKNWESRHKCLYCNNITTKFISISRPVCPKCGCENTMTQVTSRMTFFGKWVVKK